MNDFLNCASQLPPYPGQAADFDARVHRLGKRIPWPYTGIVSVRRLLHIPMRDWLAYRRGEAYIPWGVWRRLEQLESHPETTLPYSLNR